jgi:hypothetical protein
MDSAIPKPKRKPGRPATGRDPLITLRLPRDLGLRIEGWQKRYDGMSRSTAIRCLLELGLHAPSKKAAEVVDPKNAFGEWVPPKRYKRTDPPKSKREAAKRSPEPEPVVFKPRRRARALSNEEVAAAVARAEALGRKR